MRTKERLLLVALFAFAFFLLLPALVEGPKTEITPSEGKLFFATFFNIARLPDRPNGDQDAPLRLNHPEGIVKTYAYGKVVPGVRADANGHPLGNSTYIKAVYQAFRLEDRSG